ncbi:MAG: DUF3466 family protein, partial [Planctomycetota bacterium]
MTRWEVRVNLLLSEVCKRKASLPNFRHWSYQPHWTEMFWCATAYSVNHLFAEEHEDISKRRQQQMHPFRRSTLILMIALMQMTFIHIIAPNVHAAIYSITDLGYLPGGENHSRAYDINESGQVVGTSARGYTKAFLWDNGQMTELGRPCGYRESIACKINNNDQIAVNHRHPDGRWRAFLWENGINTYLGALPGGGNYGNANGINNHGQVVGTSGAETGWRAFVWDNGTMTDLGDLPGGADYSDANDINDAGQIVGVSSTTVGKHAFLVDGGIMTDLGDLSGGNYESSARAINNNGHVVGTSKTATGFRAFLWDNGFMNDLGDLPGGDNSSAAIDINDMGQVVGNSQTLFWPEDPRAFIWDSTNGMLNLNDLMDDSGTGWTLLRADGINNSGQIVGTGVNPDGFTHGYLLTLISEPATLSLDIKPGSCPNPLNTNTRSKGRLPMAILGTDNFDVIQIDANTISIADTVLQVTVSKIEDVSMPL